MVNLGECSHAWVLTALTNMHRGLTITFNKSKKRRKKNKGKKANEVLFFKKVYFLLKGT